MADEHLSILLGLAPSLERYRIVNSQYMDPKEVNIIIPQV